MMVDPYPDGDDFQRENPIMNWVFEIDPLQEDEADASRLDQIEELVDRLYCSESVLMDEAFDVAGEARKTHLCMVEAAVQHDTIEEDERDTLVDCFDRLVTFWINSPTEVYAEYEEYQEQLEAVRSKGG